MTIGQKFLVYLTLFAFLPSTVVIYIGWYLSCREIRSVNDQNLLALHAQVTAQIENFIGDGLELARAMGQSPPVVEHVAQFEPGSTHETLLIRTLANATTLDPVFFNSSGILNLYGLNIVDSDASRIRKDEANSAWYTRVLSNETVQLVLDRDQLGRFNGLVFSAPVRNSNQHMLGVIRNRYEITAIQKILYEANVSLGPGTYLTVVAEGQLMADGFDYKRIGLPIPEFEATQERTLAWGHFSGAAHADRLVLQNLNTAPWTLILVQPFERYTRQERHIGITLLFLGFCLFALISLAALSVSRQIVFPLREVQSKAALLAQGQLHLHIEEAGPRETQQLAKYLNEMAARLEDLLEDLNQQIHNRKQAESAVLALNAELEMRVEQRTQELAEINRELESFSYSVSHDLRSPLRAVDGFSRALEEDYGHLLDSAGLNYLARIRRGAQRMGQLIDDLLRFSKLSRTELVLKTCDLGQMTAQIFEDLQASEPNRKVKWRIHPVTSVQADANLIHVALENLAQNAWKFTAQREEAVIEFGQFEENHEQIFYFRDNGAGFDPAFADKLFGVFQRLHDQNEFPGTGIGLATVQRIVHKHNGRIWANAQVDHGACFYFTLPSF